MQNQPSLFVANEHGQPAKRRRNEKKKKNGKKRKEIKDSRDGWEKGNGEGEGKNGL